MKLFVFQNINLIKFWCLLDQNVYFCLSDDDLLTLVINGQIRLKTHNKHIIWIRLLKYSNSPSWQIVLYINLQEWLLMYALCKVVFKQLDEQSLHESGGTKLVALDIFWKLLKTTSTRHINIYLTRSMGRGNCSVLQLTCFPFHIDRQYTGLSDVT